MANNLYLMSGSNAVPAREYDYEYESELQRLIADNPHLVDADQNNGQRNLFLVKREFGTSEDSGLSLDHLFVDGGGVPVLVEVKRAVDTRIRREVVAQVIDYASTASTWDVQTLRQLFRETNSEDENLLQEFDSDEFWDLVATNLKAEKLKLVFAADKIPARLRNIVEFLDRNMETISVYAVEIRQFTTADAKLVTSNVIQSSAKEQKTQERAVDWNLYSLLEEISQVHGPVVAKNTETVIKYATTELGLVCQFSHGKTAVCRLKISSTNGFMNIYCGTNWAVAGFHKVNTAKRLGGDWTAEKVERAILEVTPSHQENAHIFPKWVEFNLAAFSSPAAMDKLLALLSQFHEVMRSNGLVDISSVVQGSKIKWNPELLLERVTSIFGQAGADAAHSLMSSAEKTGLRCSFGSGAYYAQYVAHAFGTDWFYTFACGYRDAWIEVPVDGRKQSLLGAEWTEEKLRELFKAFPKLDSGHMNYLKDTPANVKIDFRLLLNEENLAAFEQMVESLYAEMRSHIEDIS